MKFQSASLVPPAPGWRSLIQSVTGMDDDFTNQSDYDTPTQEESEPQLTSGKVRSDCIFFRVDSDIRTI